MSSLSRFKIGLLLWLIVTVCLGVAISTGVQTFDPAMRLSGMMPAPGTPSGVPPARPLVVGNRGDSLGSADLTHGDVSPAPAAPSLPVCWTGAIPIRSLSELANPEPLLNRPINFSSPTRAARFTMVDSRGKAAQVKTVGDYLRLKSQGYHAKTAADSVQEISAKAQLYPLIYLRRAIAARQSFVRDFDITAHPLATLPPTLGPILSTDQAKSVAKRMAGKAGAAEADWKRIFPSARVSVIDKNTIRIADRSAEVRLTVLAWGDFNRAGLEEVLVSAVTFDRSGAPRYVALAALTRATKTGPLAIVDYQP